MRETIASAKMEARKKRDGNYYSQKRSIKLSLLTLFELAVVVMRHGM